MISTGLQPKTIEINEILMTQKYSKEYKGHTIRAAVSEVKGGRFHALVTIERDDGQTLSHIGFLEVPPAQTPELALKEGWRCAEEEIDSLF